MPPPVLELRLSRASAGERPGDPLDGLARRLAGVRLRRQAPSEELEGAVRGLSDLNGQGLEAILALDSDAHSVACEHACLVARLGIAEARSMFEAARRAPGLAMLRDFRRKTYVSLMTVRYTLLGEQRERVPFWRVLLPALSARLALATFRDALASLVPLEVGDVAWSSFVAQSELRLLLAQPVLEVLSESTFRSLAAALDTLYEATDYDTAFEPELERGTRALHAALDELNARDDLRQNDERALRELLGLVLGNRGDGRLPVSARNLLLALRGRDPELDAMAEPTAGSLTLPWSHLYARASELLAASFGGTWHSGAPPRRSG